jgi:hypothetical protein
LAIAGNSFGKAVVSVSGISSFLQGAISSWGQAQTWDSSVVATDSLISAIGTAETNLGRGMASIANGSALNRVNSQLKAGIESLLQSSTSSKPTGPLPATATGTVALSVSTTLASLGIIKGGTVYVTAGGNTTTYSSTGSDTIGDLINAFNIDLPTNAQVTASISSKGDLVFTSRNHKDIVTVGGVFARNIGFGVGHQTFKPTPGSSTPASTTKATSTPSKNSTSSSPKSSATVPSAFALNAGSAASLLSESGVSGSLVNLLA